HRCPPWRTSRGSALSHPPRPATPPRGTGAAAASDAGALTPTERPQLQLVLIRFLRHRVAVISLIGFLLIVAFAFLGPELWKYDHLIHREIPADQPPSWGHPFGTTRAGHDYMGQIMRGTQQTLKVGFVVAIMSTVIGAV